MNATGPYWWEVHIVSCNGLVPSGNKPLPEPVLTQIYGITRGDWVNVLYAIRCVILNRVLMRPVGCFTNITWALQNILSKFVHCRNRTSYENFKLKLYTCAQSHALGTCTKFQLEILTINMISDITHFYEIILESSQNVTETTPWLYNVDEFSASEV